MNLTKLFDTRYLPHIRRTLKPRTVAEYDRLARKVLLPELGGRDIATLTLDDAETLHAKVPGTVQANRTLALLSAMLTFAARRRLIAANPCLGVKRNPERGRQHFYMPVECRNILAAAEAWLDVRGRYIALTLLTGTRPRELADATVLWRHGSVLLMPDGKTGTRPIYLSPAACAILDALTPDRDGRYFPRGMDLRRAWAGILKTAGVPVARLYDLRHTFASAALAAGESLPVIGQLLGHRKYQTTLRYAHLAPDTGLNAAAAAAQRMGVKVANS